MHPRSLIPIVAAVAMGAACFQPVDPAARTVTLCNGDCPLGECDDTCSELDGGRWSGLEREFLIKWCARDGGATRPCTAYRSDVFDPARPSCGPGRRVYCVDTVDYRTLAVSCADGGPVSTDCTRRCDGGTPPLTVCRECVRPFCIR